jgi:hypothetical protein
MGDPDAADLVTLVRRAVAKGKGAFYRDCSSHSQYTTLFFERRAREISEYTTLLFFSGG